MEYLDVYPELCGKIREKFRTQKAFALAIGMNPSVLSRKLSGKSQWLYSEVAIACRELGIPMADAPLYFDIFLRDLLQGCNEFVH